ncbi:SDR family oxidoreductase [Rugamonas apoptosis]|uniref:SDR family oxidoreductase n=1 Tax=Rugamonas apoptosis TaxID=2758570 RepID=A0A7W2F5T9_9BURK|nr:SDR family oxidoreductase [Rugamonas apoptosis]MBA5685612.1 SDR family oxidoreductase [Rugamonas apoptosis]
MNVLVLGATGLIGGHTLAALRAAGCHVIGASRRRPDGVAASDWHALDMAAMTEPAAWLPLLAGVDAVVNCVGIIRARRPGDFDRLHRAAPVALFAACEQLGVRRVIQLSALGSDPAAATDYWRSKGEAEAALRRRRLHATIVRPSLVYGEEGASSRLFRTLATLPLLAMPMAHGAPVQPIHVDDLAAVIVRLLLRDEDAPAELAAVGPRALSMAGYLAALRAGMGAPPALVLELPLPLARLTARLAALHPASALTPDAQTMLERSADGGNTADAGPVSAVLARTPRDPASFARPVQLPAAVLGWGAPALRIALALLWLVTAWASWWGWPHADSVRWLAACGVPPGWREPLLLAASGLDGAIGSLLLLRPRRWLWPLQLALVAGYSAILTVFLPAFWGHPFGVLSKNLPLLAAMLVLWRLDGDQESERH